MKGYKAFNKDWTCNGKQYKVGETFEEDVPVIPCKSGMHFCKRLSDVFKFYDFNPNSTVVAEVEAIGDVETSDGIKYCTNKLKITCEISWGEVLEACNPGRCNTGHHNTGYFNTGNYNVGNYNTGYWNTGHRNAGNCNTGNFNTGNFNDGNYNTGDCNTGDWNVSSFNNGCFMTTEPNIWMFDRPSCWTYRDWMDSQAAHLLNRIPKDVVIWVWADEMSNEEKQQYPQYKTLGGYLKVVEENDIAQLWWDKLCQEDKDVILALPNFDADIFYECTGIKVE